MSAFLTVSPTTDPSLILELRDRQYASELIAAALLHFDFFTWIDASAGIRADEIATELGLESRPLDVLLTLCRSYGFIFSDGRTGGVHLTAMGREYLTKESPWFLGAYFSPLRESPIVRGFVSVLKTGKPGNWQAKTGAKDWHESMLEPDFAKEFTELMNCRGLIFGQALANALKPVLGDRKHLLDIGGGSGIYSTTMVAAHPQLSATVMEQEPVDAITRKEIARHGLESRVDVVTADMFGEAWPKSDIVLLSNVLHDWDVPQVRELLGKAHESLEKSGLLIIHDAFIHDDKRGPVPVAEYSALLMNITQGKCYSPAEFGELLDGSGFETGSYQDTIGHRGFLTAVKR